MTRKHFRLIAAEIAEIAKIADKGERAMRAEAAAKVFQKRNIRFDVGKFYDACGGVEQHNFDFQYWYARGYYEGRQNGVYDPPDFLFDEILRLAFKYGYDRGVTDYCDETEKGVE